ncbi:MAG: hypothetical protein A2Z06_00895 [Candidatus Glassbacteria bacterium RBG_16_58_8]|uniref:Uncharacterized protein n=1 Tax=Candidatus Glassbacteria bacterium RBG_16_58_8 TaxID=1817866 RepID=A0A1F5YD36_9BACT|nr:MAG: hypothetical protein A2Z06_00895 [Candidatus Glassbacteria bacterium RBG_16_58_8]
MEDELEFIIRDQVTPLTEMNRCGIGMDRGLMVGIYTSYIAKYNTPITMLYKMLQHMYTGKLRNDNFPDSWHTYCVGA